ncbi:DeoR/GlpR family DNA-binding transcription regulator [Ruminococcaceae bacterium OttesenSCG-928-D13]|nr:DeoR/GlpR family DNA-binding transcription regulator [Ruminococcaceae bacterium OttesenSCG-928-D13]
MVAQSRKEMILQFLRDNRHFVTVDELCENLYVSGATVRRDLAELENNRMIRRVRGGAILMEGSTSDAPVDFREGQSVMQKQVIAGMALGHIQDGMTLFMDASSTVFTLARKLDGFVNLRVITNGLKAALQLSEYKGVSVMCTGGTLRENSKSLVGQAALDYIANYNADVAFMSCRGFSVENGASEASEQEFHIKRQFMQNSKKSVLMVDSSKHDIDYLCRIAPLSRFDDVISERKELNELCKAARG